MIIIFLEMFKNTENNIQNGDEKGGKEKAGKSKWMTGKEKKDAKVKIWSLLNLSDWQMIRKAN